MQAQDLWGEYTMRKFHGQTKFLLRLAISMSLLNIILSYGFLTGLEGDNRLLGIPFATVVVTWISTIIVMNRSLAIIESSFLETYPLKKTCTIAVISLIAILPVILLSTLELSSICLLYTSPSPRDLSTSRMPSSA